jgi:predicted O-methyltransferase YrrM
MVGAVPTPTSEPWIDHEERVLYAGATEFALLRGFDAEPGDRPLILKTPDMVERYVAMLTELEPRRIVEVGVFSGTSTAAIAEICPDATIVAVELNPVPPPFLVDFVERTGRHDTVHAHFGVDQSDRETLATIVADEFGGEPIDLVIDDASHRYDLTLATFEVLFPLVRPGGTYLIEDWDVNQRFGRPETWSERASAEHRSEDREAAERAVRAVLADRPLVELTQRLLVASADSAGHVVRIRAEQCLFEAVRGDTELDPSTFTIDDLYDDHLGLLRPY